MDGDFVLGETNRFGRSLTETLVGPTFGAIGDIDEIRAKLMYGDDAAASSMRLILSNTPFASLFYVRPVLDYMVLHQVQEAMNPGYLRRMERRVEKEQNQKFILKPSEVVR